ncbi:hypothetical protein H310_06747 [Aphanomyces invadans]|uniref:Uncharacterized protein n=1 Tax=Aphanomyces invadans TaxID=157072 RepID=A0A024U3Y6_9STRA|nr:hypothetical protein H310_06747 [Aphanomyces invadans]ETW01141.1 hypothetical protein H310_06747 [Aphanomyces invadans]RHY33531.1 hypothetical protein DYB32_001585 [Aphanomyces invadans]|eukprot:XP_008870139.1 hypothetical protein H310_06747 [Aphanomyces invadans]
MTSTADRSEVVRIPVSTTSSACIELECDWGVGIGGSLWTSGRLLVDYMARNTHEQKDLVGRTVLELGSGTGLVGLAMAHMGPSRVIVTDLDTHVASMERNLERNASLFPSATKVEVVALDWTTFTAADANALKPVDLIVGTDIAYLPEFYEPLRRTLELLVNPSSTRILLGLGRHDTDMRFFRMLVDAGYEYYKISDDLVGPEYRGKDFGLFDIRKAGAFDDSTSH